MARTQRDSDAPKPRRAPAKTVQGREDQLVNLAIDLAEQQLMDGTASSQVMTHFLKLGTVRERAELERLQLETKLVEAKIKALESGEEIAQMYADAMIAMTKYQGRENG